MAGYSLVPFNPRRGLATNEDFFDLMNHFFSPGAMEKAAFRMDIHETDAEYVIEAELPGVQKDEVSIDLTEGRLVIAVTREETAKPKKAYLHRERRFSSMSRAVQLSDTDPQGIKAKLEHGVLTVTVKKEAKQDILRKIEIE